MLVKDGHASLCMHYSVNTQHEVLGLDLYVVNFEDLMTLYDEAFEGKGDLVVTLLDVANARVRVTSTQSDHDSPPESTCIR